MSLRAEANIRTQERGGDQCSVSLPVSFLIPQDKSVSAPTPLLLSHASICLLLPLCVRSSPIPLTFTRFSPNCLSLSVSFLSPSSPLVVSPPLLHLSPSGLLCLLFVSPSRSPPAEDGDVSRCRGYRGDALGITAATFGS